MNQQFMIVRKGAVESAVPDHAEHARKNPHLYTREVFSSIDDAADLIARRRLTDCYIIQLPFPVIMHQGGIYPTNIRVKGTRRVIPTEGDDFDPLDLNDLERVIKSLRDYIKATNQENENE